MCGLFHTVMIFVLIEKYVIIIITFMLGLYNYIPQTKQVSRAYSVAAVTYLKFLLDVMLFGT
jgi:hypothetical protein